MHSDSDAKLYLKLYQSIEQDIINGKLKPGDKLPSYRQAAKKYTISMATVVHAHTKLAENGIIEIIQGSGCYVRAVNARDFFTDQIVLENFREGQVSDFPVVNFSSASPFLPTYPIDAFATIFSDILAEGLDPAFFAYGTTKGARRLRAALQGYAERQGIVAPQSDFHVTNGGQQAIDLVCKLFRGNTFSIMVEEPGYPVAVNSFVNAGAEVFPIPLHDDGCDVAAMERVLKKRRIDLMYMMTNYQSPTGICWSEEKKKALLTLAEKYDFFIVEDDCWSDLYFDGVFRLPLKAMDTGSRVIYIKSFSKIFMPGLRAAFILAPERLEEALVAARFYADIASGGFLQESFARFIEAGLLENHTAMLRGHYKEKCTLMQTLLRESGCFAIDHEPAGGLCLWVRITPDVDSYAFYRKMRESNIRLLPGNLFSRAGSHGKYVRLSFAVPTDDEMRWGVRQIARVVKRLGG